MADSVINPGVVGSDAGPQGERLIGFLGRRAALFGLLLVNSLLGIVTIGFYRFWARTRLRQFFWNNIEVDGDPLEYTGRGLELFIGFLIVVAILVPLSMGYSVLSVFLDATAPSFSTALNFVYFLALLWLARYAFFRARRYRLARTVWRGIRAGQDGSAAGYAWLWLGHAVFSTITLGWGLPWMTAALQEYEVEHARFGVENFSYKGAGGKLLRWWAPCGAVLTLALVAALGVTFANVDELQRIFESFQQAASEVFTTEEADVEDGELALFGEGLTRLFELYWIVILALLVSIPFYYFYRISALRYMFSVSNLSEAGFVAGFSTWRIVGNWLLYTVVSGLAVIVLLSMLGVIGAFAGGAAEEELTGQSSEVISTLLGFVGVLLLFMFMPVVKFLLFHFPVIRHVATTLAVTDIESLDRIVQSSKDDPRFGEGLASALDFDVGGF